MFFPDLTHRRRSHELMDDPDIDPKLLQRSLGYLRKINKLLGYTRQLLDRLDGYSQNWNRDQTVRIVDIGTGSADMPIAVLKWADERGWKIHCTGVDLHAKTAKAARDASADPRLTIVRGNALDLPFHDNAFDYAITSTFLHHLDTDDVVKVIAGMSRIARRGVVIADLVRSYQAYAGIKLATCLANPVVRHDGPASIGQAFTKAEVLAMRDRAGLTYTHYEQYFYNRFILAGEK
jgi:ubiquinone/menaquinone biosynthesis C-methylase UbiE